MKRENFLEILDRKGQVKFIYRNGVKFYVLWATESDSVRASGQTYSALLQLNEKPLVFIIFKGEMRKAEINERGILLYIWAIGHRFKIYMPWANIGV